MQKYLIVLLLLMSHPVMAFELFGVTVNEINRIEMREAIRKTGAEVVREAGDDNWYDVYKMSNNFKQSKFLFVAYEKATANFAFAEYHLPYDYLRTMLSRLKLKYGKPDIKYGAFESANKFVWQVDGIDIVLTQDWNKNISRLTYSQPATLASLRQAYQQSEVANLSKLQNVDGSYY